MEGIFSIFNIFESSVDDAGEQKTVSLNNARLATGAGIAIGYFGRPLFDSRILGR